MNEAHGWLVLIWLTKSHLCMCIHVSCVFMYHVCDTLCVQNDTRCELPKEVMVTARSQTDL